MRWSSWRCRSASSSGAHVSQAVARVARLRGGAAPRARPVRMSCSRPAPRRQRRPWTAAAPGPCRAHPVFACIHIGVAVVLHHRQSTPPHCRQCSGERLLSLLPLCLLLMWLIRLLLAISRQPCVAFSLPLSGRGLSLIAAFHLL
jgi:hypothetical protein